MTVNLKDIFWMGILKQLKAQKTFLLVEPFIIQ